MNGPGWERGDRSGTVDGGKEPSDCLGNLVFCYFLLNDYYEIMQNSFDNLKRFLSYADFRSSRCVIV